MALKNKVARALLVGMTGVATLALTAGTAQASNFRTNVTMPEQTTVRGTASFLSDGDSLAVCDRRSDGRSVAVDVEDPTTGKTVMRVRANGNGQCSRKDSEDTNLVEGRRYVFWSDVSGSGDGYTRLRAAVA
ncbi:hypothetical protein ACFYYR_24295 [Streptomyces sp. NPDC001922]|uniref:hypothetical protein n=1 Tax=Streptomyces sp. NPDC001922 TaxID=3364624 RepID=UPI0036C29D69